MVDFYNSPAYPYPVPDPYWEYAPTWHELQDIKKTIEDLITDMAKHECSDEDFDRHLDRVTERLRERLKNVADVNASAYIDADELEHISAQEI